MEELWKDIENFPLYEASTLGNIRNKRTKRILKPSINKIYKYISLFNNDNKRVNVSVHRIIAKTFIDNIDNKPTVNHKDHNPSNNNINNLEWATYTEQGNHRRKPAKEIYEYTGTRPVWRICPKNSIKLERYNSIKAAAKWVFNNGLTKVKEFGKGNNIKTKICAVIRKGKTNGKNIYKDNLYERKTAYGFKWEYDNNDTDKNISNEIWKEIPYTLVNFKGYSISTYGRVKNNKGRITNGFSKKDDYLVVNINKKHYYIHRLVALVFLTNQKNKPLVNHIDGNKQNPKLENLEWIDYQDNSKHAVLSGKIKTKAIVQYDSNNYKINEFNSIKEAAENLKISTGTVSNICNGKYVLPRKYTLEWKLNSS
jgi:hypothetical protein